MNSKNENTGRNLLGSAILLVTAIIWGSSFVAQTNGAHIGSFTFQAIRTAMAAAFLFPVSLICDLFRKTRGTYQKPTKKDRIFLLTGGLVCGSFLFVAINLQQLGIFVNLEGSADENAVSGKAAFVTALYILIVPLFGLFKKIVPPVKVWFSAAISVLALYLLCVKGGFTIMTGDVLLILCAAAFSLQIWAVDKYAPNIDGVKLSCIQFTLCAILSSVFMFALEKPELPAVRDSLTSLLYSGVASGGVAYTLQIIGQKYTKPALASLIMSFESVFAVLFGALLRGERLTTNEAIGCVLMFLAILLSQLPVEKLFSRKKADQNA